MIMNELKPNHRYSLEYFDEAEKRIALTLPL
jgi:hypothetical protein